MNILITGCAGFIGFHLAKKLLEKNKYKIFGIDNLNSYYDIKLKDDRLKILKSYKNKFFFRKINISNLNLLEKFYKQNNINVVFNLAAQAGVRLSIQNPSIYFDSNITGFFNILNLSIKYRIKHLIYASSSSVYGDQIKTPFKEDFKTDEQVSFYAASKKINEIMAFNYSHTYKLRCTGVRFFTVYGPMGRPDMAIHKFTNNIIKNKKINLYNSGNNFRDFTHVDDVTNALEQIFKKPFKSKKYHDIVNIGYGQRIKTSYLVSLIERNLGKKSIKNIMPPQKGDVKNTQASNHLLKKYFKVSPKISIEDGISEYISWFRKYYL